MNCQNGSQEILRSLQMKLKVWRRIDTMADSEILQEDLNELGDWSMDVDGCNSNKCKVMHVGLSKPTKYYINEESVRSELKSIQEEKDLGVLSDLI